MATRVLRYNRETNQVEEHEKTTVVASNARWPLHCEALAVNPNQVEDQREADRMRGIRPTQYDKLGRPIMTSNGHYREYKRAYGYFDKSGFDR